MADVVTEVAKGQTAWWHSRARENYQLPQRSINCQREANEMEENQPPLAQSVLKKHTGIPT